METQTTIRKIMNKLTIEYTKFKNIIRINVIPALSEFFRTTPFWHNFTGITRRSTYEAKPRTWFDSIAKIHDIAFKFNGASQVYFGAFKSAEQSKTNIETDMRFFQVLWHDLRYFTFIASEWEYSRQACEYYGIIVAGMDFIFELAVDFLLIPFAVVILGLNIILNYSNIIIRKRNHPSKCYWWLVILINFLHRNPIALCHHV